MVTLNKTTKKAVNWIDAYNRALNGGFKYLSVHDFYAKPSTRKIQAEAIIRNKMQEEGGEHYRILGGNSSFFTCGYKVNNKLVIFTGFDTYTIEL